MLDQRQENGCGPRESQGKSCDTFRREDIYAATRRSVESTRTLIPDAYRSSAYYEVEEDSLFGRAWVCVGYTSQVRAPGDTFRATVAGQPIFVTRDRSGSFTLGSSGRSKPFSTRPTQQAAGGTGASRLPAAVVKIGSGHALSLLNMR